MGAKDIDSAWAADWRGDSFVGFRMPVDVAEFRKTTKLVNGGVTSWIHMAPFGHWSGHEKGPFTFDEKVFSSIIAEYERQKSDSQIDYEHDSLKTDVVGPKPAAGWIKQLELRSNGLWAEVEWTKRAAKFIEDGEYKYCSPAMMFKGRDRKTGKRTGPTLRNCALTNEPFLDGLTPIALTRIHSMGDRIKETTIVERPAEAAMAEGEAPEDAGIDATAAVEAIASIAGMDVAATVAALLDKQEAVAEMLMGIAGEDGSAAEGEMAEEAEASRKAAEEAEFKAATATEQVTILSRRVETLEAEKAEREQATAAQERAAIEKKVDGLIEMGNCTPDGREACIKAFSMDAEWAEEVYSVKRVPIGVDQKGTEPAESARVHKMSELSETEQDMVASMVGMSMGNMKQEDAIAKVVALRK